MGPLAKPEGYYLDIRSVRSHLCLQTIPYDTLSAIDFHMMTQVPHKQFKQLICLMSFAGIIISQL
jgi:hypothetical protein